MSQTDVRAVVVTLLTLAIVFRVREVKRLVTGTF